MSGPRNTYRDAGAATPSRLVRIRDANGGDICQLNPAAPGVIFDAVTGNPIRVGTEKWLSAVERLVELNGHEDVEPLTGEREDGFERMRLRVGGEEGEA